MAKYQIKENNFVNFSESDIDKYIYRVFKIEYLLEVFIECQLTLVKPSLWDDPFENFLMKADNNANLSDQFSYRDEYYGQCWTHISENDAIWRIYAPEKNGVLVKVSIQSLVSSFLNNHIESWEDKCFVGNVEYKTHRALLESMVKRHHSSDNKELKLKQAYSLFIKRREFSHEKEFRLVLHESLKSNENIYKFPFDPYENFLELTFDPRMDKNCYIAFKDYLFKLGYNQNKIRKSSLYSFPKNPEKSFETSNRFFGKALPVNNIRN